MIDPYQFYEAKAIGADAVLLIAAILDDAQMKDFYQLSKELELDALVLYLKSPIFNLSGSISSATI